MTDDRVEKLKMPEECAVVLTHAAVFCWLLSLCLPGFAVEVTREQWFGWKILIAGFLLGWTCSGWAAYANLFFAIVVVSLYFNKKPVASVCVMLLLAATLPIFDGVVAKAGSQPVFTIASWGWGFVMWVIALFVVTGATAIRTQYFSQQKVLSILCASIAIVVVGILIFRYQQWNDANQQDREFYLSGDMAFTHAELCSIPLVWPNGQLVPPGAVIRLEIDPQFQAGTYGQTKIDVPQLGNYEDGRYSWVTQYGFVHGSYGVKIRYADYPARYMLRASKSNDGAVVQLFEISSYKVLYEQKFKVIARHGANFEFCPFSLSVFNSSGRVQSFDKALLQALGQGERDREPAEQLSTEVAQIRCNIGAEDIDGIKGLHRWDGRDVMLVRDGRYALIEPESNRPSIGFCSKNYVALVRLGAISASDNKVLRPTVQIHKRDTLKPIAIFTDYSPHRLDETGVNVSAQIVNAVRIDDKAIILETGNGEIVAHRYYQ